jgi:hypothetical protein
MFKTPVTPPTVAEIATRPHRAIRFLRLDRVPGPPPAFRVSETIINETAPAARMCAEVSPAA